MLQCDAVVTSPLQQLKDLLLPSLKDVDALITTQLHSDEHLIQNIAFHLINAGGKRLRPMLCLACSALSGGINENALYLAATVELIHAATLLHDDVIDESNLRRGTPTANSLWGNKASILVGDFLFARAFGLMVKTQDLRFLDILAVVASKISEGEVAQLRNLYSFDLTIETYLKIIEQKTATLFAAACKMGALTAKADKDLVESLTKYGLYFGLMYQIMDDVLDYTPKARGKEIGDDFKEGKITLPVLLAYTKDSDKEFWGGNFQRDKTAGNWNEVQNRLKNLQSLQHAKDMAMIYGKQAQDQLKGMRHPVKNILYDLIDYCLIT